MRIIAIIMVVYLALAITGGLVGRTHSVKNATARLAANIIAGLMAVFLTPLIVKAVGGTPTNGALNYIPDDIEKNPVLLQTIYSMAVVFTSVVIYLLMYLVFYLALRIPVNAVFGDPVKKYFDQSERKIGAKLGSFFISAFSCAFTLMLVFSPIYSIALSAAGDAAILLKTETNNPEIKAYLKDANDSVENFVSVDELEKAGERRSVVNSFVYDNLTNFSAGGQKTNLHKEIRTLCAILSDAISVIPSESAAVVSKENVELLRSLKNELFQSAFLKTVTIEVVNDSASAWYYGGYYLAQPDPLTGTAYEKSSKRIYGKLMDANEKEIDETLDLLISMYKVTASTDLFTETPSETAESNEKSDSVIRKIATKDAVTSIFEAVTEDNSDLVKEMLSIALIPGGDDKPAGDKPAGDKPAGDKPSGDKPSGDKPAGDKPSATQSDAQSGTQPEPPVSNEDSYENLSAGKLTDASMETIIGALVDSVATVPKASEEREAIAVVNALDAVASIVEADSIFADDFAEIMEENLPRLDEAISSSEVLQETVNTLLAEEDFVLFELNDEEKTELRQIISTFMDNLPADMQSELFDTVSFVRQTMGL